MLRSPVKNDNPVYIINKFNGEIINKIYLAHFNDKNGLALDMETAYNNFIYSVEISNSLLVQFEK